MLFAKSDDMHIFCLLVSKTFRTRGIVCVIVSNCLCVYDSVKEVVCFGEGAGANILARFAVSLETLSRLYVFCAKYIHS